MRLALAGLGTVGTSTIALLRKNAQLIKQRSGQNIQIVAVSARDRAKARRVDLTDIAWENDPRDLATRTDVDCVIELMGGAGGVAAELATLTLTNGKHLVTANKALIATRGAELAKLAVGKNVQLSFEAAVCGAVPVLKTLREALAANAIISLRGILNGTCNYILTRMQHEGMDFDTALGEAQALGYAEADPSADIDGIDSANKLAILTAVAFGLTPALHTVFTEGIRSLTVSDLQDAAEQGGALKLLGISAWSTEGVVQRVQPVFVPNTEMLAFTGGVQNALQISTDYAGSIFIQGQGAGGDATASAVVGDIIDIMRGYRISHFEMNKVRQSHSDEVKLT